MQHIFAAEAAAQASGSDGHWQLIMIVGAIVFLALFARFRRRPGRETPARVAQEYRDMDKHPDRYRTAADKAMVELLETASSLTAEVNTKCRILNRLVKDAEEQTARLERLLAEARGVTAAQPPPPARAASVRLAAPPAEAGAEAPEPRPANGNGSELFGRVAILAAEGKSAAEIAKAVNLSIVEVAFALNNIAGGTRGKKTEDAHE